MYDEKTIVEAGTRVKSLPVDRLFYAIKANSHPQILAILERLGFGFECVSVGEISFVRKLFPELDVRRILFTPNFAPRFEYREALAQGVWVTVDSLYSLQRWTADFADHEVLLRIDTGNPDGHHEKVRTAGPKAKFGIAMWELDEIKEIAAHNRIKVVGLHAHVGSGIRRSETWGEVAALLGSLLAKFPDVKALDIGGGLGIVDNPNDASQAPLSFDDIAGALARWRAADPRNQQVELWLEPGRYLVAEAGVLLTLVTQLKDKGTKKFVGVSTGFNSLIRPTLYSAYHHIINFSQWPYTPATKQSIVDVVGPICETGDVLGFDRSLPESTQEDDVILIATAGAYGYSMSSHYNMRDPAFEILLPLDRSGLSREFS